mmetsp:Transcript_86262/g.148959  ORF Transcript_86262/g.148959 Transcript_86262/m.148959 type:complete len:721 (+) Transcript_86262:75-2237(+)
MQKITLLLASVAFITDARRVQPSSSDLERNPAEQARDFTAFVPSGTNLHPSSGKQKSFASPAGVGSVKVQDSQRVRHSPSFKLSSGDPGDNPKLTTALGDVKMSTATSELDDIDSEWRALNDELHQHNCDEECEINLSELHKKIPKLKDQQDSDARKTELEQLRAQMQEMRATHLGVPKTAAAEGAAAEESESWFIRLSKHNALFLGLANLFAGIGLSFRNRAASISSSLPEKKELKKMLPLAIMLFFILFNYTVLRDTKDVLVVTSGGAEVIPFLKTYVNLPAAIGVTVLYSSMVNRMSGPAVFYTFVAGFAAFFGLFAGVIFPNLHLLHPTAMATSMAASLPSAFAPFISIFKFWTFGAFYTCAQLWGSVVVSLLFWGFANEVCSVSEAKRWYPLFGMLANVALIFSGQFVRHVSALRGNLPAGVDPWGYSLKLLMSAVVAGAGVVLGTYRYMQKHVLTDPDCVPATMERKTKKKKPKMSLGESFKYLASSSYIRNLAFLVICYGTSINIVEVTWKAKLAEAFTDPNAYSSFMGTFSSVTGAVTLSMMILSRWVLSRFGWGTANLVTPVMLGLTGIGFFSLILFQGAFAPITAKLGLTPLMMAVVIGAAQNVASKASKYSFFEPCKETAIIPLDSEMRTKGKAAIDVIGNPLGKSGGSFIQQLAIVVFGSLSASSPFLAAVLFGMIGLWMKASRDLAKEFNEKEAAMKAEEEKPATAS